MLACLTGCSQGSVDSDSPPVEVSTEASTSTIPTSVGEPSDVASSDGVTSHSSETERLETAPLGTGSLETGSLDSTDSASSVTEVFTSSVPDGGELFTSELTSVTLDLSTLMGLGDGGTWSESSQPSSAAVDAGPEPWDGPPIVSRAGYVDIEPLTYSRNGVVRTSSSARLFYSFRPADEDAHLATTFVFFNGGPGYGTSLGLLARGTGPMTVGSPEDSTALVENPWSWAQLGNLLYIDTRQAGFSYSTIADPSDSVARRAENSEVNFNDYLDPADLVRVMLRVLAATPGIQDNPVVLVGESYGGVRATMMLTYLLNPALLRTSPNFYTDAALADEIDAHYAAVGHNYADPRDQFPAQVLIQPFIAGTQFEDQAVIRCLPGSTEAILAEQYGIDCEDIDALRDSYNIREQFVWSDELDVVATAHVTSVPSLQLLLGVDPTQIVGLGAADRVGAFRLHTSRTLPAQPSFVEALGIIESWDAYHVASNYSNFNYDLYDNPYPCVYFPWVIGRVATFVTDADADMVVDTPALPTTMMKCQERLGATAFVDDVVATHDPEGDEPRPGHWTITYNDKAPYGAGERKVRWPTYEASHMVAVNQPQQLFEDVREFLRENAVITR